MGLGPCNIWGAVVRRWFSIRFSWLLLPARIITALSRYSRFPPFCTSTLFIRGFDSIATRAALVSFECPSDTIEIGLFSVLVIDCGDTLYELWAWWARILTR